MTTLSLVAYIKTGLILTSAFCFCYSGEGFGGVAHLARALAWHARGSRFKSDHLHKIKILTLNIFPNHKDKISDSQKL